MNKINILPEKGEVYYFEDYFILNKSDDYYQKLLKEIEWIQEPIIIFGKSIMQPRLTAWYGEEGKEILYSGIKMSPHPWNETLLEIKTQIEKILDVKFTSALLNLYRDGNDSMGWHRDNEKELGKNPTIASVSLGETRPFFIRNYQDKKNKFSINLEHGSLLVMKGETQHYWEHSIPKRKKIVKPRINITFRVMI